jgi:BlaI family penicillinase repressor
MRPKSLTLTPQELEIMKVVWRLENATVRQVYEALLEERKIAYTTVMTMMKILEKKNYLVRSEGDRAFVYRPAASQRGVIGAMVAEFVDRVFNGAAKPLMVQLVEDRRLSPKDMAEIKKLLAPVKDQEKGK